MNTERKKDLHRRYLTRELSEKELEEFYAMIENGTAEDIVDFDEVAIEFPTEFEPSENIAKKILRNERPRTFTRLFIERVAAAVITIAMLLGGYQGYQYYSFIQLTETFVVIKAPSGKSTEMQLQDGTRITLASGTIFKYPKAFTKTERRVYLIEGQAFFDVAHDKTKPFRVNSGEFSTTALGTSFMIRHYKNYAYEKISLYTGKVRVDRNGLHKQPVFLLPGQEYDYHNGILSKVMTFDNSEDNKKVGTLSFKRTPFRDAIYRMSSLYGVNIQFNEAEFQKESITGDFNMNTIEETLHSLTFVYPFKVNKIDSSTYKLTLIEK